MRSRPDGGDLPTERRPFNPTPARYTRRPSPSRGGKRSARTHHDLHHQAEIPSPGAAEKRARLHPPRLRGHDLDAVRRLRPRLDHRRDHRGLLRTGDRAAPRRQDFRHRLFVQDHRLFPRRFARLQLGAWPHAVGADRRQSRQPRPDLSRRLGRRRHRLDRLRPVRPRRCGAASTWSTSSRTTACTA